MNKAEDRIQGKAQYEVVFRILESQNGMEQIFGDTTQ